MSDTETPPPSEIPSHLNRWNWGAFLLNWIWGIGNSVWIALLALIPIVNLVVMVVLGLKGSRWAWRNRLWRDEEHFRRTQRQWAIAGVIVWVAVIGLFAFIGFSALSALRNNDAVRLAMAEIRQSTGVTIALGEDIQVGTWVTGNFRRGASDGLAQLRIPLKGNKGSGTALVRAIRQEGEWELRLLVVRFDDGRSALALINRDNLRIPNLGLES